jgi:hypothetical protein
MELLDEKRTANLERLNNIFELQKENLKKMSEAFEYQAWEDFAVRIHSIVTVCLSSLIGPAVFKVVTTSIYDGARLRKDSQIAG